MRNSNDNRNLLTANRILFELDNLAFVTVTSSDKGEQDSDDQIDNLCSLQPKPQASSFLFLWRQEAKGIWESFWDRFETRGRIASTTLGGAIGFLPVL